jgi:HAMP domain-containing protein
MPSLFSDLKISSMRHLSRYKRTISAASSALALALALVTWSVVSSPYSALTIAADNFLAEEYRR